MHSLYAIQNRVPLFCFFFCLRKFIAGNFRVLVEVLNRKINSFVAGTVNMLGSVGGGFSNYM